MAKHHTLLCLLFSLSLAALAPCGPHAAEPPPTGSKAPVKPGPVKPTQITPEELSSKQFPKELPQVEGRFEQYRCPERLIIPRGSRFTNRTELVFQNALVSQGPCANDLNPTIDKGGFCLTCAYEANLRINRSGGKNYRCWVSERSNGEFTCEYVAPPRPAQSCEFELQLPVVNLMPYTRHTRGDRDLHSTGYGAGGVRISIDAEIRRGGGIQTDALFLVFKASQSENFGDRTTFEKDYAIELSDPHYVNASAADVANCLAAYGTQRPLSVYPKGKFVMNSSGHEWKTFDTRRIELSSNLIHKTECRFDTKRTDDMKYVGCRKIWFKPDVKVSIK